jgi:hypothetical protein
MCVAGNGQEVAPRGKTSYVPVNQEEPFAAVMDRMAKAKPAVMQKQMDLLNERYDLADKPAADGKMSRGKALQAGVRVKLPVGAKSWDDLANLSADEIKQKNLFPMAFARCRTRTTRKAAWSFTRP